MDPNELVIDTKSLSKSYNGVAVLESLNLQVPKNSIFGFLGPNGAGKTTTIKLLLGLTHPTSGSGTIFGQDIVQDSVEIRKRIGYLAQDPRFYEHMTARETLPDVWPIPIILISMYSLLFVALAIWRFQREEF